MFYWLRRAREMLTNLVDGGRECISRKQDVTDCGSKFNFKDVGRHDENQTIPRPLCVSYWKIVWIKII